MVILLSSDLSLALPPPPPPLLLLGPFFIWTFDLIRVGGRLAHAPISYDAKFPVILPQNHPFTWLYVEHLHRKHLHAGAKALIGILRLQVWIVNARNLVRKVVNSRPLTASTNDPNDGEAITPAHLLIGTSLQALPDQTVSEGTSTLTQYQRITYLKQRLWDLWRRDYLHELQLRSKWLKAESNVCVGQLVLVHEDNLPPQQWQLARITSAIPGSDGRVRVVDLKINNGTLRRPIHKVAPLPVY